MVAIRVLLAVSGVALLAWGITKLRRLRRWSQRPSPTLNEYDPGPDWIDWLQAIAILSAGVASFVLAFTL